jgi:hypothetical protein
MLFSPHGILRVNHFDKFGGFIFDIGIAVFPSSAFHREQAAAVNVCEVAVGKLVASFAIH